MVGWSVGNAFMKSITLESIIDVVHSLKNGKCADEDGIHAEHFKYAPLNLITKDDN